MKSPMGWLACCGVLLCGGGCNNEASPLNGGGDAAGGGGDSGPGGGSKVCRYVGDPDKGGVVYVCDEVWDCEALPNGDKKCSAKGYGTPDGTGGWDCTHEAGHVVCVKHEPDAVGGGGWSCEGDTCVGSTPAGSGGSSGGADAGTPGTAPPGGGSWNCVTDHELGTTTCTSGAGGDVPDGGGSWNCTIDAEFITCESTGGGPVEDGGSGGVQDAGPVVAPDSGNPTGGGLTTGGGIAGGGQPCWCPVDPAAVGLPSNVPLATITSDVVTVGNRPALRARITYSTNFCDNTYGVNAIGWSPKRGHKFGDLVGSDHQVIYFHDCNGRNVVTTKLDYITADPTAPSGYGCLGVSGGDGAMLQGDLKHVVGWSSSLDENFNTHGYVLTVDSPATDASYTVNPQYPSWIYEMWYQVDIDLAAFGSAGPCRVSLLSLHASPAKTSSDTVDVVPCPCI